MIYYDVIFHGALGRHSPRISPLGSGVSRHIPPSIRRKIVQTLRQTPSPGPVLSLRMAERCLSI